MARIKLDNKTNKFTFSSLPVVWNVSRLVPLTHRGAGEETASWDFRLVCLGFLCNYAELLLKRGQHRIEGTYSVKVLFLSSVLLTRPNILPAFPLISSKLSAFFFCGIKLLPVLRYKHKSPVICRAQNDKGRRESFKKGRTLEKDKDGYSVS